MNKEPVLIRETAYRAMCEEADACPVETGGVLLGYPHAAVVLEAGRGGEHAVREAARFSGDPEADARALADAREQHGERVGIVGYYHKHPAGYLDLSGTDIRQARKLARDGHLLLVAVLAQVGDELKLLVCGCTSNSRNVARLEHEIVRDSDARIKAAANSAPVIPNMRASEFWADKDFRFYENPVGRARLTEELKTVRELVPELQALRANGTATLWLRWASASDEYQMSLPREYPLNPPRVFLRGVGELLLDSLTRWNSERTLLEVLSEAQEATQCPRCRQRALRSTS